MNVTSGIEKITAYFKDVVYINPDERAAMSNVRSFYKWMFELLKNVAAVVALWILAKKSNSNEINIIAGIYQAIISLYLYSYIFPVYIYPFSRRQRKWTLIFDLILAGLIFGGANVVLQYAANKVITDLTQAQVAPAPAK